MFRQDSLNPEQRLAAEHRGGPLLVLAGAGTGKTATLSARVASLLDEGADPQRILLLTFTRRAAREMINRTSSLVGERAAVGKVTGGTFHSVGHRFVRSYASALGLPADFGLLDAGDAADVLDLVRNELGHPAGERRFPRKQTLADIYTRTVNAQRPVREIVAELFPWCEEHLDAVAEILRGYSGAQAIAGRARPR